MRDCLQAWQTTVQIQGWAGFMLETLAVLLVVAIVGGASAAVVAFGWLTTAMAGIVCAFVGLIFGVPTGFYYHVQLHRCLAPRGALPPRWWWSPVRFHALLSESERRRVMRWFYAGGLGFGLVILGGSIALLSIMLAP